MASVSEWIVREYFEQQGYLVTQPGKYMVTGRPKRPEEELDLLIEHPLIAEQRLPAARLWSTADLRGVRRAVVGIYGWHTERVYPTTLEHIPDIARLAGPEARRAAARRLGSSEFAVILCLPRLPVSRALRDATLARLQERGVDGVLPFRLMLTDLLERVDGGKNYEKSDLLQVLRILKTYDLLKAPQLELFVSGKQAARRKKKPAAPGPAAP